MTTPTNLRGKLREVIEAAKAEDGYSLGDLTVLATQNDPYRLDTSAGHRDGEWLAVQAEQLGLAYRVIHLRGLHYMLVSAAASKPDGTPYLNNDDDWVWLESKAAKAARWLGYIDFDRIIDQRNAAPINRQFRPVEFEPVIRVDAEVKIPDDLAPRIAAIGFEGVQPFKLVLFGEKSSLGDVLGPLAGNHEADLYLPTGEISDTLLYHMAKEGEIDGRRMVVLTFSDCDPSGWQMPISIARKLQAFKDLEFPDLDFEVRRVALTPDQVRTEGLPSSPLKDTEKRADKWLERMGVEQTEIDALAALNPDLLRTIALHAIGPFYDHTLAQRVTEARAAWLRDAQEAFDEGINQDELDRIRGAAERRLQRLREQIEDLNGYLWTEVGDGVELPEAVIPEAEVGESHGKPLIDSDWDYTEATLRLRESKAYRENGGDR